MDKKEFQNKFWRMKPIERLEYHVYEKEISERYDLNLEATKLFTLAAIICMVLVYGIIYFYGNGVLIFKEYGEIIFRGYFKWIPFMILFDFLYCFMGIFIGYRKKMKKLNKRFGLIKNEK